MELRGRLFAPRASAHQPASLLLAADGILRLRTANADTLLPPGSLTWSSRVDSIPRRATLADGQVFETPDNDSADTLLRTLGTTSTTWVSRLERMRTRLLVLAVLALVIAMAGIRWGVPAVADVAARWVPHSVAQTMGEGVMTTLDRLVFNPSQAKAEDVAKLDAVFHELVAASRMPEARLLYRASPTLGANAFALPGDTIIMTDELLALVDEPAQLAGVLAHEIGHLEYRHSMRRLARAAGLAAVIMLITGEPGDMLHDATAMGAGLLDLSYSRQFEREADARATELMTAIGRDPRELAIVLEKLVGPGGRTSAVPEWLSSHPAPAERIEALTGGTSP